MTRSETKFIVTLNVFSHKDLLITVPVLFIIQYLSTDGIILINHFSICNTNPAADILSPAPAVN